MQKLRHLWPWVAMLAVVCVVSAPGARAQGGYAQGGPFPVFKYVGGSAQPASGATITVCAATAVLVANPPGSPICPSQESDANCCFSDLGLTQRLNGGQPFPADSRGNVAFTAVPGAYQLSVTGSGILSYTEVVSVPCVPGNSAQCGAFTNANNNWTGNNVFGPGSLTVSGTTTTSILNGDYVTGSATYPATGAGLQAAVTAAAGLGCVYVVRGTYTMSTTLTIPSNSCIYWDNATIASNGYNGDLISSTSTSNITFRGKLILNGAGAGSGSTSQGINFTTVTNFSFEDIESSGTKNSAIQLLGSAHIRGNKIYVTGCNTGAGATSSCVFGTNNATTPLTDIQIDEIEVTGMSGVSDCVYFSGTTATPSLRINIAKLDLQGCTDSAAELNFVTQANLWQIAIGPNITNSGLLLRRGVTDINVNSVACASGLKICVDVANFQASDPTINRVTVNQVTATGENTDLVNGAAVRVFNNLTTSSVLNVSFGLIVADTSTRGFYCVGTTITPTSHITVNSIITHNNKGDGILLGNSGGCNDVTLNTVISFDNNQGGTTDEGVAIKTFGANGVAIGSGRVFDDQGAGKTQKYGLSVDSTSLNVSAGILDCQDSLEVTGCLHDASNVAALWRRKDATGLVELDSAKVTFNGATGITTSGGGNLNDFGAFTQGKQFLAANGTVCTNGELALSAGWQSTGSATVTGVAGTGQTCSWTVTTGTTTAANPTITDTLTNGIFSTTRCWMFLEYGPASTHTAAAGEGFAQTTLSGSAPIFTFNGTPTAGGKTYLVVRTCGP